MGYYYGAGDCRYGKGDYYRGDYYRGRGDPGLFDFVKKIGGAIIKRSPFGLAAEAAKSVLPIFSRPAAMLPPPPQEPVPGLGGTMSRILPFGETGYFPGSPYVCGPDGRPRGHLNKSTYVTRGGGTSRYPMQLIVHPKGTVCVGPRRMNVANPRALRRALRRASGFAKLARRYVRATAGFKKGAGKKKR
jgi:hypothetical protein